MSDPIIPPPPPPPYAPPAQPQFASAYAQPAYGHGYPPPAPKRSGWVWVAVIVAIVAVVVIVLALVFGAAMKSIAGDDNTTSGAAFKSDSIAVVEINGVILDADKIDKQIDKFGNDSNVKAIILEINSPGGGAAASQEIYHEVMRVRSENKKLVVASMQSVGASGAYYIASACDKIYANPASVVGSIGVIMEWTNYGELLKWAKMKNVVISKGELKDAGDPTRDLTPKEEAYFQSLVDNMYGQFVHDVAVGRHTTDAKILPLATGQVWTGEQALPLGLIDAEGGFHVALMNTAKTVGISGEPKITRSSRPKRGLRALLDPDTDTDDLFPNPSQLLNRAPGFYFLWK